MKTTIRLGETWKSYLLKSIFDPFKRASNLKGVETRISQGKLEKSLHKANALVMTLTRNLVPKVSFLSSLVVCKASSLVGHNTSARNPSLLGTWKGYIIKKYTTWALSSLQLHTIWSATHAVHWKQVNCKIRVNETGILTLNFIRIGSEKANVFPEPVGAQAKHSRSCKSKWHTQEIHNTPSLWKTRLELQQHLNTRQPLKD